MTARVGILALVTECFGGRGGIAQYNRDLLSALIECEAIPSIVIIPRMAQDSIGHVPKGIEQLSAKRGRSKYALAALARALTASPQIVFCGHLYMTPIAWLAARITRAKLVIQMHGIEAWERPSKVIRAATEAADLILCVSRYTRTKVLEWASVPPERIVVLPNTVSEKFSPGKSALRATLGLDGRRVLLTVGRMDSREAYKGHDRIIEAMPRLIEKGHDLYYLVLGEGDDRVRLEALAMTLGVADRLLFLGPVNETLLLDAYRAADLFVMPSTGEGFGIAFLEAMASGTPALGLSSAGACDALLDGQLGIAVSTGELVDAIASALTTPRRDRFELSGAVRERFGGDAFRTRAHAIANALRTAA